jgi:drug/metabolite transporter (DMT)-like permease
MIRMLAVLAVGLVLEATGVVLISKGQKELQAVFRPEFQALWRLGIEAATNRNMVLGIAFEAGFFGCLLYLLSRADVSFVWPLTSLSLVVTTLTARWLLHEQVSPLRWAGVCLIMLGAGVVTFTEKQKEQERAKAGGAASTAAGTERRDQTRP